jgi:hypothetical protein
VRVRIHAASYIGQKTGPGISLMPGPLVYLDINLVRRITQVAMQLPIA